MGKSLHMLLAAELKRPPLPSGPNRALYMGNTPEKEKKKGYKPTGELAVFREIAKERSEDGYVLAKHIDAEKNECTKKIYSGDPTDKNDIGDLRPENFSHILAKGMHKEKRLDKDNIEIVSRAWHFFEHNQLLLIEALDPNFPN